MQLTGLAARETAPVNTPETPDAAEAALWVPRIPQALPCQQLGALPSSRVIIENNFTVGGEENQMSCAN